ncbi:MAG: type VI secretion system tip protein VgrG, partial [Rhodocyclaceae bacterium]|nr:type VI secretion system tip protein VgrG [Rhodocyclaceae bacterium]
TRFELFDHPHVDGEHFIVGVTTILKLTGHGDDDADGGEAHRDISIDTMPATAKFRPARVVQRPRIHGLQTARVTGPAGSEIHCDEYGRVKVQFHWDPYGVSDDHSSCWIRTVQPHTTGSIMIPRVGWEVLVRFEDGDPDRPVVLGHVFNPMHAPDYSLPDQATVTGHRSTSSP